VERRKLRPGTPFIGGGEREREGTIVVPHISNGRLTAHRSGEDAARVGFPYPRSLIGGPRSVFSNLARVQMGVGRIVPRFGPLTIGFLFFQTEPNLYIMKLPFCAPKFTKLCNLIESKIRNNFPFGNRFEFEAKFELKFLEPKLLLNLGQFYWGSN
jgi:hypothetical protein